MQVTRDSKPVCEEGITCVSGSVLVEAESGLHVNHSCLPADQPHAKLIHGLRQSGAGYLKVFATEDSGVLILLVLAVLGPIAHLCVGRTGLEFVEHGEIVHLLGLCIC